jgi:hypothetical protein
MEAGLTRPLMERIAAAARGPGGDEAYLDAYEATLSYLAQSGAQVFLTTTDASLVRGAAAPDTLWLDVQGGQVTPRVERSPE